jgi:hypothetical protein
MGLNMCPQSLGNLMVLGWWPLGSSVSDHSSACSSWVISGTGRMVPQPFVTGGNRSYPKF